MKKRIMAIIISTAMVLTMVGCGKSEPAEESTKTAEEVKEEQIRAEIEDEATEGAVEALVEHVVGEEEADTRIKKVDDVPQELWDACVANAEKKIESLTDAEYRLVRADVKGKSTDDDYNVLTLIHEFNMGDGTVKYAPIAFNYIHTGTLEDASRVLLMELHYYDSFEEYDSALNDPNEIIIFDSKTFE